MSLTKAMADALCTVIAVGFIVNNETAARKTKFIYETEADPVKEAEAATERDNLNARLAHYGVNVHLSPQGDKYPQPFIFAKTKYISTQEQIGGVADDFHTIYLGLETEAKKISTPIFGAYIGGKADLNKIELCGPSYLYLYNPIYRTDELPGVERAYNMAKATSNALVAYLKTKSGTKPPGQKQTLRFLNPDECLITDEYVPGKLFASCHGMILAMDEFGTCLQKEDTCVELALGKDTCKVASCLPCSLFMSANDMPASATHLGRGDNWNLPQNPKSPQKDTMNSKWRAEVVKAYNKGVEIVGDAQAVKNLKGLNPDAIPDVFLEALTFEGSFSSKIRNTLG